MKNIFIDKKQRQHRFVFGDDEMKDKWKRNTQDSFCFTDIVQLG